MTDDEEKAQLRHDVAKLREQVKVLSEHIEVYERDVPSPASSSNSYERDRLVEEISSLKAMHSAQEEEAQTWSKKVTTLEKHNQELIKQKKELEDLLKVDEVSDHETTQYQQELTKYKEQFKELEITHQTSLQVILDLRERLANIEAENQETSEECERVTGELRELRTQIKALKMENVELEARASQATNLAFASRGNSMFGEFAEERRNLEQDMKKLHGQLTTLKKENTMLKMELEDAKLRSNVNLGSKLQRECNCKEIEIELHELREKVANLEHSSIVILLENLDRLQNLEKANFYRVELQKMEETLVQLRKEKNEAKDCLRIEQAKVRNAECDNATLRAQIDTLEAHLNEQRNRLEEVIRGESPEPNPNNLVNMHLATPSLEIISAPKRVADVTPSSILRSRNTDRTHCSFNLIDGSEAQQRKAEQSKLESDRLESAAKEFRNRNLLSKRKKNGLLSAIVTTPGPEEKKAKMAAAPKPLYTNFPTIVFQSPAKKIAKENENP